MKFKKIISVCSKKDADVWKFASHKIIKFIESEKYEVIVPDSEVDLFKRISPKNYTVINESHYSSNLKEILRKKIPLENQSKLGWYLQQFTKIHAAKTDDENDYVLIWDADTVPLKELSFFSVKNKLMFYAGKENHESYFTLIDRLLGLKKNNDFSFIAQCFPIKTKWLNEFFEAISDQSQSWEIKIISEIDFSQKSGFSEYETLGTYFLNSYSNHMIISDRPWLRLGNSRIGSVKNIDKKWAIDLLCRYDFASFETWDRVSRKKKLGFFIKNLREFFIKFI